MSVSKPQTRAPLNARQRSILTAFYEHNPYPSSSERHQLVQWTGRTPKQVQDWFSNRRVSALIHHILVSSILCSSEPIRNWFRPELDTLPTHQRLLPTGQVILLGLTVLSQRWLSFCRRWNQHTLPIIIQPWPILSRYHSSVHVAATCKHRRQMISLLTLCIIHPSPTTDYLLL